MKLKRSWMPALVVSLLALVTGGWLLQQSGSGSESPFSRARLLEQVHQIVAERYVEDIGPAELYQMAIDGMLRELGDPYTTFLDPSEVEQLELNTTGNYGGLGIRIDSRDGWITVVSVLSNTPAQKVGLQPGDRILQVEGESAEGWSTTDAVNVLRGEKGTRVTLTVARIGSDRPLRFTVERAEIHVEAVIAFMLQDGVGYVKLDPFSRDARAEVEEAVDGLRAGGARSLILDLRGNPGGLLDEGVAVADLFLPRGAEVVATRSRVASENEVYRAPHPDAYPDMPLIVMVDGFSASASEIVAGALQDHDRALVVGTTSFGKGSVQSLFRLSGGNYLKLTTGRWYTPVGRTIQKPHDRASQISRQAVSVGGAPVEVAADTAGRKTYRTDNGRVVYGGGGIIPDLRVVPDTLTTREQLLRASLDEQGVSLPLEAFRFAVRWAQEHPDLSRDFEADGAMRDAFYRHLNGKVEVPIDRRLYEDSSGYIRWLVGLEVAGAAFGEAVQWERKVRMDRQVGESIALLREADDTRELFALASARAAEGERADAAAEGAAAKETVAGSR